MRSISVLLAATVACIFATSARASVVYDFSGSGSSFSVTTPTFVTSPKIFTGLADENCSGVYSGATCSFVVIEPNHFGYDDVVIFVTASRPIPPLVYKFQLGTLGQDGYASSVDGENFAFEGGTLTVSGSPSPVSGAPEPSTWALMMLGIGGAGVAISRAKRKDGAALA
jgi:hypothetical protein